jgi:hypothetical protein
LILTTTVRQLLEVDKSRRQREKSFVRVIPPAAAVANLLLCATFEPLLREESAGHFLALFLLTECALLVLLNFSYFGRRTSPVLVKTRIFPIAPGERYIATVAIEVRRRIVLALIISTAAFLALFFRSSVVSAACAVVMFLLLSAAVETVSSAVALMLLRTAHPSAFALALGSAAMVVLVAGLIVFDITDLLAAVPLVNWGSAGMLAGSRGNIAGALISAGSLTAACLAAWFAGSRYS